MNKPDSLPDFFEQFKEVVFKADRLNEVEACSQYLLAESDLIQMGFAALREAEDWVGFGVMFKTLKQYQLQSPVYLFDIEPSKQICTAFDLNKEKIANKFGEVIFYRAKLLYRAAKTGEHIKKYLDRHRFLESAIRMAWGLLPADENDTWKFEYISRQEISTFIAQCYLFRSKLALPKGSDIPEKKLEAIEKAWEWSVLSYSKSDDLKLEILLEKDRWDKNTPEEWIKKEMIAFFDENSLDIKKAVHRNACDRGRELGVCLEGYDKELLGINSEKDEDDIFLPLYQAKAALRIESDIFSEYFIKAVNRLENIPLSYHLWDDTVDLIQEVKKRRLPIWKVAAINAWELCRKEEERLKLSIQIRWYWARQTDLYELAFRAAESNKNIGLMASVVDSLKSRPSIKLSLAEKSLYQDDKDSLEKFRETETNFSAGNFHIGLNKIRRREGLRIKEEDIENVPMGWAAVHFYISSDFKGYAIIFDRDKQFYVQMDVADTWVSYNNWKTELQKGGGEIKASNKVLKILCETCGGMLGPIIEKIESDNIIFIPYGFLHLVPLHASLIKGTCLLTEKICVFLPAWSLKPTNQNAECTENAILLTNWKAPDDPEDLKGFINDPKWSNSDREACTTDGCISAIKAHSESHPQVLAFYCHGEGNFLNPYQSALKMHKGRLTHQQIIKEIDSNALQGTKVILTACESDLTSGNNELTDEHLSIANAFLHKGASEVAGTLYKCTTDISGRIISSVLENMESPLYEIIHNTQKQWLNGNFDELYKVAAFRTIGLPVK
jgi:hypothetical protein